MIVADMLVRCDWPHYRAVLDENGTRRVWPNEKIARVFTDAIRLPGSNQRESFRFHEVETVPLPEFWDACDRADWHYANSDDHSSYRRGGAQIGDLQIKALVSKEHQAIYDAFFYRASTGPAYGTERAPKPPRP